MGESYYEYYLAHHGIKGQKWGVRRYQNTDGSLTAVGKKRYAQTADGSYRTTKAINKVIATDIKYKHASSRTYDKKMSKTYKKYEKLARKDEKEALKAEDYEQYGSIAAGRSYLKTITNAKYRDAVVKWAEQCAKGETYVKSISRDNANGGILIEYLDGTKIRTSADDRPWEK